MCVYINETATKGQKKIKIRRCGMIAYETAISKYHMKWIPSFALIRIVELRLVYQSHPILFRLKYHNHETLKISNKRFIVWLSKKYSLLKMKQ